MEMRERQRRKIVEKINNYLIKMKNDRDKDARILHLLSAVKEALKKEKEKKKEEKGGINII